MNYTETPNPDPVVETMRLREENRRLCAKLELLEKERTAAIKLSRLIERLVELKKAYGDLPVYLGADIDAVGLRMDFIGHMDADDAFELPERIAIS